MKEISIRIMSLLEQQTNDHEGLTGSDTTEGGNLAVLRFSAAPLSAIQAALRPEKCMRSESESDNNVSVRQTDASRYSGRLAVVDITDTDNNAHLTPRQLLELDLEVSGIALAVPPEGE